MKMKNKRAKQIAAKQKHKENLKVKRREIPDLERPTPKLNKKPTILIVCEGTNTEPSYFNQFRLSSARIISVGEGYNTVSLVNRAAELAEEHNYDQVWCVFDADPKPDDPTRAINFNTAITTAVAKGYGVAYSNQAFEYWLILHFLDHQGNNMPRTDYDGKLNELLKPYKISYDGKKSKIITEDIFDLLHGSDEKTGTKRVDLAIKRAERNYRLFDHTNPFKEESSTTVFRLVKELQKYL